VPNVYRRGAKDVHAAIVSADPDDPSRPAQCSLDGPFVGTWSPKKPPGPECPRCFRPLRRNRLRNAAGLGSVAALALLGGVVASPDIRSVIPSPTYGSGESALASPSASVTPGPSVVPPGPSLAPALTPSPTVLLIPVLERVVLIVPPVSETKPAPTSKPCVHPGSHLGVDPCKWPHN
jgi:hypothetical protein